MGRPTIAELRAKLPCQHRHVAANPLIEPGLGEITEASQLDAAGSGLEVEQDQGKLLVQVGVCADCCEIVGRLGVVEWKPWQ
jgi:hypothetical protein